MKNKQQSKRIDDALNKALMPPKRRPSPMLDGILSQYTAPVRETPSPQQPHFNSELPIVPVDEDARQRIRQPQSTPVETSPAQHAGGQVAGFTKISNDLLDRILKTLDVYDQIVLIRLWRLSYGFDSDECSVAQPTLAKSCNISERQIRISITRLEAAGHIKRLGADFNNKNLLKRGTSFKMLLPDSFKANRSVSARAASPAQHASPAQYAYIKDTSFKDTHNTAEQGEKFVRVCSRFSLQECRKYAESLRRDGIKNPGGYATKIHRSGEADEQIECLLNPVPTNTTSHIDVSNCPDCHGTGFYEPGGAGKGVAKCKHGRLSV